MWKVLFLSAQLLMTRPVMTEEVEVAHAGSEYRPLVPTIETSGKLIEGSVVLITCSALSHAAGSSPKLRWTLQEDSQNQIEETGNQTFITKVQENITLSYQHDGLNISCSASYPVNEGRDTVTAETTLTLDVSYSPRDTAGVISPTGPVSVGSVVNLTCSCTGNPPAYHFEWFMIKDGRPEGIYIDTQVYSVNVTDSDRGQLFFCGCHNLSGSQFSRGHLLMFEDDRQFGRVGAVAAVKILALMMLISTLVIFECWFKSRRSKPVKVVEEADYVNRVIELQAS